MSPTVSYEPVGRLGAGAKVSLVPLAKVLSRFDEQFEEPLDRVAQLPGYADYEMALTDIDGWPATGEPIAFLKTRVDGKERWSPIMGLHVLATAKKLCKARVPCFFVTKDQVDPYIRANAEGGLKLSRASAEDEEETAIRAYYRD